jgi:hypothetical protein
MLLQELKDRLRAEKFDALDCYSFSRQNPPLEGYILEQVGSDWVIFYFERGEARQIASFYTSSYACKWFYEKLCEDYSSVPSRKPN